MIERLYYNHGKSFEDFKIIYISEDRKNVLVKNITTQRNNKYSFGTWEEFHSIYSFPVNQSCLTKSECLKTLKRHIEINNKYPIEESYDNKRNAILKNMIKSLIKDKVNNYE